MYSIVLMAAMSGGPSTAGYDVPVVAAPVGPVGPVVVGGCAGCSGFYAGCCGGYSCMGGCYGSCYGSCHGCRGGGLFGHRSSCHGCCGGGGGLFHHKSSCYGCCGGYSCMGSCYGSCYGYGSGCCGGWSTYYGYSGMGSVYGMYTYPAYGYPGYGAPVVVTPDNKFITPGTTTTPSTTTKPDTSKPEDTTKKKTGSDGMGANLKFRLPAEAKLYVDGRLTGGEGGERAFFTPALVPGQKYFYEVKAEVVVGGQTVSEEQRVIVEAGADLVVEFPKVVAAVSGSPATPVASK